MFFLLFLCYSLFTLSAITGTFKIHDEFEFKYPCTRWSEFQPSSRVVNFITWDYSFPFQSPRQKNAWSQVTNFRADEVFGSREFVTRGDSWISGYKLNLLKFVFLYSQPIGFTKHEFFRVVVIKEIFYYLQPFALHLYQELSILLASKIQSIKWRVFIAEKLANILMFIWSIKTFT